MSEVSDEQILRVRGGSNAQAVASAIAHAIYDSHQCKLRAIGAGAVNQAVKAIAIARSYTAPRGIDLVCIPAFTTIESHEGTISAMMFIIKAN